jgi:hypothetical protein
MAHMVRSRKLLPGTARHSRREDEVETASSLNLVTAVIPEAQVRHGSKMNPLFGQRRAGGPGRDAEKWEKIFPPGS